MVDGIRTSLDCNPSFRGEVVSTGQMTAVMVVTVLVFMVLYVLMNRFSKKK